MTILRIRPQADRDTDAIADYLAVEANLDIALKFLAAVEFAYERVESHPQAGSPFIAFDTRLLGLRYWPVPGFERFLVFYVSTPARIDVVRVMHGARNLDLLFDAETELR